MPPLFLSKLAAQFVFSPAPVAQRRFRNLQKLADPRHIAVVLVYLVQRFDLAPEGITSTHLFSVLYRRLRL